MLGIHLCIDSDKLRFRFLPNDQPAARHGILSTVVSLFDPMGFIFRFVVTGKRVLQETCKQGTSWDDPLPCELRLMWGDWNSDLEMFFSDIYGYGQCSYLRHVNKDDMVHCALVTAKTRVAPIKVTSIPRLELTATVVSITVSNMLRDELGFTENYLWTDTKVDLGYINNEARSF